MMDDPNQQTREGIYMIIASSQVALSSQHSRVEQESRQESLRLWKDAGPSQAAGTVLSVQVRGDQVGISAQAKHCGLNRRKQNHRWRRPKNLPPVFELSDADKQKIALLERMLEMLTGKKSSCG